MWTEPETDEQWQEAVDLAEACIMLDSAIKYGLVTGGPRINVDRCQELLDRGKVRGTFPRQDAVERFIAAYNAAPKPPITACSRRS